MSLAKAFSRIFWGFSAVLAAIAVVFAFASISRINRSEPIPGTISRFEVVQNAIPFTGEDAGLRYYPVIRYRNQDGGLEEFISPHPVSPDRNSEGGSVMLLVTRRGSAVMDTFFGVWGFSMVFASAALLFFICGLAALKGFDQKKHY